MKKIFKSLRENLQISLKKSSKVVNNQILCTMNPQKLFFSNFKPIFKIDLSF